MLCCHPYPPIISLSTSPAPLNRYYCTNTICFLLDKANKGISIERPPNTTPDHATISPLLALIRLSGDNAAHGPIFFQVSAICRQKYQVTEIPSKHGEAVKLMPLAACCSAGAQQMRGNKLLVSTISTPAAKETQENENA